MSLGLLFGILANDVLKFAPAFSTNVGMLSLGGNLASFSVPVHIRPVCAQCIYVMISRICATRKDDHSVNIRHSTRSLRFALNDVGTSIYVC